MRYEKTLSIQNRHDRLLKLIRTGKFSSSDLSKKLDVSGQTIYRDIEFLKKQGHLIRSIKHAKGWSYHLVPESGPVSTKRGRLVNDHRCS
jgi:DeoR/GlpR family transcriptional regulator of sugar metabolism